MNNTPTKFLSLAKQGNIEAINTSLNYLLRDLEVTVRGSLKKPLIELILDKPQSIPEKEASIQYIKKFFYYLQINGINHIIIYAKQPVNNSLAWSSEFYMEESSAITNTETNILTNIQASQNILETLPTHIARKNSQITPIAEILAPVNITAPDLPAQTGLLISQGAIASGSQMEALAEAKVAIDFQSNTSMVLDQAVTAGGIAFGVELAFSGLDNFLAVQRGEKSVEDALGMSGLLKYQFLARLLSCQ